MENTKLQALTEKLYNEGLSKGKAEGDAIVAEAGKKAEAIIAEAKKQAEKIIADAKKEAEDYATKINGDLKLASGQALQTARQSIENLVNGKLCSEKVNEALTSADFVKEIITTIAKNFNAEAQDINLVLPESMKPALESYVSGSLAKIAGKGVTALFSKKIAGGFTIGPKDGSYFISFTDETFKALIGEYLRPATRKFLFGE